MSAPRSKRSLLAELSEVAQIEIEDSQEASQQVDLEGKLVTPRTPKKLKSKDVKKKVKVEPSLSKLRQSTIAFNPPPDVSSDEDETAETMSLSETDVSSYEEDEDETDDVLDDLDDAVTKWLDDHIDEIVDRLHAKGLQAFPSALKQQKFQKSGFYLSPPDNRWNKKFY